MLQQGLLIRKVVLQGEYPMHTAPAIFGCCNSLFCLCDLCICQSFLHAHCLSLCDTTFHILLQLRLRTGLTLSHNFPTTSRGKLVPHRLLFLKHSLHPLGLAAQLWIWVVMFALPRWTAKYFHRRRRSRYPQNHCTQSSYLRCQI